MFGKSALSSALRTSSVLTSLRADGFSRIWFNEGVKAPPYPRPGPSVRQAQRAARKRRNVIRNRRNHRG